MGLTSTGAKCGPAEWRRRLATGVVLGGVSLGLRHSLEGDEEPPAVVVEARDHSFWPPRPVEVNFLPDAPAQSWVVVRTWLLEEPRP